MMCLYIVVIPCVVVVVLDILYTHYGTCGATMKGNIIPKDFIFLLTFFFFFSKYYLFQSIHSNVNRSRRFLIYSYYFCNQLKKKHSDPSHRSRLQGHLYHWGLVPIHFLVQVLLCTPFLLLPFFLQPVDVGEAGVGPGEGLVMGVVVGAFVGRAEGI